jgi:hypothetical protein
MAYFLCSLYVLFAKFKQDYTDRLEVLESNLRPPKELESSGKFWMLTW